MVVLSDQPKCTFRGQTLPDLDRLTKDYVSHVLERCNMSVVTAARILGIGRTTIYRHLKTAVKEDSATIFPTGQFSDTDFRRPRSAESQRLLHALPIVVYVRHGDRCSKSNCKYYRCQSGFIPEDYELVARFAHLTEATDYCLKMGEAGEHARLVCYLNPSEPVITDYQALERPKVIQR